MRVVLLLYRREGRSCAIQKRESSICYTEEMIVFLSNRRVSSTFTMKKSVYSFCSEEKDLLLSPSKEGLLIFFPFCIIICPKGIVSINSWGFYRSYHQVVIGLFNTNLGERCNKGPLTWIRSYTFIFTNKGRIFQLTKLQHGNCDFFEHKASL